MVIDGITTVLAAPSGRRFHVLPHGALAHTMRPQPRSALEQAGHRPCESGCFDTDGRPLEGATHWSAERGVHFNDATCSVDGEHHPVLVGAAGDETITLTCTACTWQTSLGPRAPLSAAVEAWDGHPA